MPSPLDHAALWERLRRHLKLRGPTPAAELYELLGVSPPTLSRLLWQHRPEVLSVGRARAVRHGLRRPIGGGVAEIPLHEIGEDGAAKRLGTLHPVEPEGFVVEGAPEIEGTYPGLPWFLLDLLPSGFLGKLVPARHPELGFPRDIRDWTVDQGLRFLALHGHDAVGSLVVGDTALRRLLADEGAPVVPDLERPDRYASLAAEVMAGGIPGSSAGGEQPKFLATRAGADGRVPVLVKFSPPRGTEVGARVSDLLVAEHLALRTLHAHGIAAAESEVLVCQGRTFLEVRRFDRIGAHGRRGLVSLRALDAEYVGEGHGWVRVCTALHVQRQIGREALERVVWLERFGGWITNTDMHLGNLSFVWRAGRLGDLALVYDMLPMGYAPRAGEVVDVHAALPTPDGTWPEAWAGSWSAALDYWRTVAADDRVTTAFRRIAARNAERLADQEGVLRRLAGGAFMR